jgi:gamma-glutamyltranspeptidase
MAGLLSKSYAEVAPQADRAEASDGVSEARRAVAILRDHRGGHSPRAASDLAPTGTAFADDYEMERDTTSFSIVDQYGNAVAARRRSAAASATAWSSATPGCC